MAVRKVLEVSFFSFFFSEYLPTNLFCHSSINLQIMLCLFLSLSLFLFNLITCLPTYLPVCLSVYPVTYWSRASDNFYYQGVWYRSWCPSGLPWTPSLLSCNRGVISTARGTGYFPWRPFEVPSFSVISQACNNSHHPIYGYQKKAITSLRPKANTQCKKLGETNTGTRFLWKRNTLTIGKNTTNQNKVETIIGIF